MKYLILFIFILGCAEHHKLKLTCYDKNNNIVHLEITETIHLGGSCKTKGFSRNFSWCNGNTNTLFTKCVIEDFE